MSRAARDWAWSQQVTPSQKLVLLALAELAQPDGHVYRSYALLARDTGLTRGTIWRTLKDLETLDYVMVEQHHRGSGTAPDTNHYYLGLDVRRGEAVAEETDEDDEIVAPRDYDSRATRPGVVSLRDYDSRATRPSIVASRDHIPIINLDLTEKNPDPPEDPAVPEVTAEPTGKAQRKKNAEGKAQPQKEKTPDPRVREVMLLLEELQGGPFAHYPAAAAEVKRMLARASPQQIAGCWSVVKSQPFWADKPLSMPKLSEYLTEYLAGRLAPEKRNGRQHQQHSRPAAPSGLLWDESDAYEPVRVRQLEPEPS